jgi:hypothetical protein
MVATLVVSCGAGTGAEPPTGTPSTSPTIPSPTDAPEALPTLEEGPVTSGRYLIMPPAVGWAECATWLPECPPEHPLARSLRVEITIPAGWAASADETIIVPSEGSTDGPTGAGFVVGWTTPTAGLHSDPCQPESHLEPDVKPGPTVDDFVDAVVAQPSFPISDPVDVELGGYPGRSFTLTAPSDISDCYDWRPFEGGIFAQGPNNRWRVWVVDVEGLRMILLSEEFPDTPAKDSAELRAMVRSIRFVP